MTSEHRPTLKVEEEFPGSGYELVLDHGNAREIIAWELLERHARELARRWSAHDDLLAACEQITAIVDDSRGDNAVLTRRSLNAAGSVARAAIVKAKGNPDACP